MTPSQKTMCQNYIGGGPGVFVSGCVWLVAAGVCGFHNVKAGMLALFIGGMLIVPLSGLIEKRLQAPHPPKPDAKLTRLALMTLPLLFGGLYLGYVMSSERPALFFAIVAMAIGLRYIIFERVYGLKTFWFLGSALIGAGLWGYLDSQTDAVHLASIVGLIEVCVGMWLTKQKSTQ